MSNKQKCQGLHLGINDSYVSVHMECTELECTPAGMKTALKNTWEHCWTPS